MMLREELRRRLIEERGIYVKECCDKCGQLLGAVRFTRQSETGTWCSRECRDGKTAHSPGTCRSCGATLVGLRRGSRFCSDTCRKRDANQKVLNSTNYRGIAAHSKGLADAGRGFGCPYTQTAQNGLIGTEGAQR